MKTNARCCGMTLVELLIVIASCGILLALLLPAIQSVRAAARTAVCLNNGRQIGIASLQYSGSHGHFPTQPLFSAASPGWAIDLLPYLEESSLRSRFDFGAPLDADVNALAASGQRPEVYRCPENPDTPLVMTISSGRSVPIQPSQFAFNGFVLGISTTRVRESESTMLARDSGSLAFYWHSSPFVTVFDDGSPQVHDGGNVVIFVSGRAELRMQGREVSVDPPQ